MTIPQYLQDQINAAQIDAATQAFGDEVIVLTPGSEIYKLVHRRVEAIGAGAILCEHLQADIEPIFTAWWSYRQLKCSECRPKTVPDREPCACCGRVGFTDGVPVRASFLTMLVPLCQQCVATRS